MFEDGVKIILNNINENERIFFSNGVTKIKDLNKSYNQEFHLESYIPNEPWISLSQEMLAFLISKNHSNLNYTQAISIIKIPNKIAELFEKLELNKVESYESLDKIRQQKSNEYFEAMFALDEYIFKLLINDVKIDKLGIHIGKPNLFSATISKDKYVGLHIDYWDKLTLDNIDNATNRISINLGKEDRFLIFINLTVKQLYDKLKLYTNKSLEQYDINSIVHDFFKFFPNYPIIKLKQKPYEGYIAPTENIIHDGSTLGSHSTDITLTTRGYFKLFL